MALDHPHRVAAVAPLDILPPLEVWRLMDDWLAQRYYHWAFLSRDEFPARLINHDPVFYFLHQTLGGPSGALNVFDSRALVAYDRVAQRPEVVAAWCKGLLVRGARRPRARPRRSGPHVGRPGSGATGELSARQRGPLEVWRGHFPRVTGAAVAAGHFLAEECPDEVLAAVSDHIAG